MILSPDALRAWLVNTGIMTQTAAPPRSLAGRIITNLFVTIGVLATIAALIAGGLTLVFASGNFPAEGARNAFIDHADDIAGVASVTADVGSSNLEQPSNVDAIVTLDRGCSIDDLERTLDDVTTQLPDTDADVQVHPVVVCGDLSVGASAVAKVTRERMAMLRELLALPGATGAAVVYPQPIYDRFVDSGINGVTLAVRVATRDALVPTAKHLLAHPPLDVSMPTVVVDAGSAELSGLVGHHAGSLASRISINGDTTTHDQLLGAVDAMAEIALRTSATVTTTETTLEVEVGTADEARAVNAILADSGADVTRSNVTITP
ncbi:hypothetical protein GCM10027413_13010 [Conyzicola nivalis]|uniref:Uncharacterized protein n=2 Tax=Conyzicola nivalis TaxID=1477021 RepID=A0A916SH03_9MICO|nr:hypothetical protein GCM10010979_13620 [Conyzicola nivalis]